ncbi:MAG TPA: ABC transporter ATP-binding protein [Bryobacteraceae bacterium]|nr:ABC transporter ATP-binding protein [Bryobacteraceae bacterium]
MLEIRKLRKAYGATMAVDGVSFHIEKGQTLGLLGPNGAGKTTTVSIISGLIGADSGEVLIEGRALGSDTDPVKRRIGLVPQDLALYDELSAQANLEFFGALYELTGAKLARAAGAALELVGLTDKVREKVKNFSGGMKRRLNLAVALLHDPDLLLLDEPTVGVDPQSRNAIFENLETLKQRGKTLLYTTHYMEEAERLCDRLVVVDHGRVIANDTLHGLYRMLPASNVLSIELEGGISGIAVDALSALAEVRSVEITGATLRVGVGNLASDTPRVLEWLNETGHSLTHLVSERPDLETVFLTLTGRKLRDS